MKEHWWQLFLTSVKTTLDLYVHTKSFQEYFWLLIALHQYKLNRKNKYICSPSLPTQKLKPLYFLKLLF